MRRLIDEETLLGILVLFLGGISPNLFPAAQAGIAKLSWLATRLLIPSLLWLILVLVVSEWRGHRALVRRALGGAAAGMVATLGLELVRTASFRLGGMPGDLPQLLGVLLTDRFMLGPSQLSNLLGYAYHFWNGASFGLVFAVLLGRRTIVWTLVWGQLIGLGFLVSPAVKAMGIGFMGLGMPAMPITVVFAHLVYGTLYGRLADRWVAPGWLFCRVENRKEVSAEDIRW